MSSENVDLVLLEGAGSGDEEGVLELNSNGTLSWADDASAIVGTSVGRLSTATWHRIEIFYDAADDVQVRVDGTTFLSIGAHNGDGIGDFTIGVCVSNNECGGDSATTADYFFDDIAINDNIGVSQTSWPGPGSIVHMQPDGAGDSAGCTAGTWASVDEITPDDGTTECTLTTDLGGNILDVSVETPESAGIDPLDSITLVHVGAREQAETAAAESWNLRIKSASGGTTSNGSTATHDDTTYRTNGDVEPRNYTLTSYTDPTTAVPWKPTGTNSLANMQIGANSIDAAPDINLTTLWALVEYVSTTQFRLRNAHIRIRGGHLRLH